MVRALVLSPSESMTSGEGPTNASPAISTLRANSAFSDKNPYLATGAGTFDISMDIGERGISPWVDHVHTMLNGDTDDIVLRKICPDRS